MSPPVVPIHNMCPTKQDAFFRQVLLRKAKLSNATDMSVLFALFAVLGFVDLNINEEDGNAAGLIFCHVVTTALLVTNTVLVKIGTLWTIPGLETMVLLYKYNISEMDRLPAENFMALWDWLWILASYGGFILFGIQFILMAWIKFQHFSVASSISATMIMTPVLCVLSLAALRSIYNTHAKAKFPTTLNSVEIPMQSLV